jgi:glycosyltransferase involved in cell wall biosynthesis
MKIAIINQPWGDLVPPKPAGSIPILVYETAQRLAKEGHHVAVYNRARWKKTTIHYEGVDYIYLPVALDKPFFNLFGKLSNNPLKPFFLWDLTYFTYGLQVACDLRKEGYDWVHIHNFSQFIPIIRRLNPTIKVALQTHCEWLTKLDYAFAENRLQMTDLIINCSDFLTQETQKRFPHLADRCHTVLNGLDANYFRQKVAIAPNQVQQNAQACSTPDQPVGTITEPMADSTSDTTAGSTPITSVRQTLPTRKILYVGRVSPEKGIHVLLEAFERVHQVLPDVQLDLVGPQEVLPYSFLIGMDEDPKIQALKRFYPESVWADYLTQWQRSHPAGQQVTFVGKIDYAALRAYYQAADLFVFPSICDEAFGMPVSEAMVTGLPVITTQAGALPELVGHGRYGWLVEPNNGTELANRILEVLQSLSPQPLKAQSLTTQPLKTQATARSASESAPDLFTKPCHPIARLAQESAYQRFDWQPIIQGLIALYQAGLEPASSGYATFAPPHPASNLETTPDPAATHPATATHDPVGRY